MFNLALRDQESVEGVSMDRGELGETHGVVQMHGQYFDGVVGKLIGERVFLRRELVGGRYEDPFTVE